MKYAIADYLTDEQKARALAHHYAPYPWSEYRPGPYPRDEERFCPLGRALQVTTYDQHGAGIAPGSSTVSRLLTGVSYSAAEEAARQFIKDWDAGLITDLADALGVKE